MFLWVFFVESGVVVEVVWEVVVFDDVMLLLVSSLLDGGFVVVVCYIGELWVVGDEFFFGECGVEF